MTTRAPAVRERAPVAAWVTDPAAGELLARRWVDEHRPERRVVTTSTHTALYRGPGEVSARVSVVLDGETPAADALTLLVHSRHEDLEVTAFPDDPALPTLPAVLSRAAVEPVLVDPLPGRVTTGPLGGFRAEVVHHPREGACVLRIDLTDGDADSGGPHREVYAKVYPRAHDASMAADALAAIGTATLGSPRTIEVRVPRLLALSRPLHTTFLESLTPAGVRAPGSDAVPVGPAESVRALRALHSHNPAGPLPSVTVAAQVSRVGVEQDLVATAWPEVAERVDAPLRNAAAVLGGDTGRPPVLSHGDFTPSQLIRLPHGFGLVDLDTLCLAEPAADLGRYLAYHDIREAARGAGGSADPDALAAVLAAYGGSRVQRADLAERVRAYRDLNLVLLVLRATRRFKSRRADLALTLLHTGTTTQGRLP